MSAASIDGVAPAPGATTPTLPAPTLPTKQRPVPHQPVEGGIGESVRRPDGILKVKGDFAYSSDLWSEDMLWGATLRSPHPHARILAIDTSAAIAMPGVSAVLTHEDIPGRKLVGLEITDTPVIAIDTVRYHGEPVAIVAADHPETARRALARIEVTYEVLEPLVDPELAMRPDAPLLHPGYPGGNVVRHIPIRFGDIEAGRAAADVVVSGTYEVGMQDQAPLGPESGLAVPAEDGGIDLYVATQWMHVDRGQLAAALGIPPEKVRITLAGVGGAFGAREDLSMQAHACLLAMRTDRPVKMVYSREESFFGHVHRHPCTMYYEHGATFDGDLTYVHARLVFDGGAYASSSPAVISNATCFAAGPYNVPAMHLDGYVLYTNNPPCGAMRGFGSVQVCFGHEAQMDKLARALGMDPIDLRLRNAMEDGNAVLPTGQNIEGPVPVAQLLEHVRDMPMPETIDTAEVDLREMPGGVSNTTHGEGVVRGVGIAIGFKNVGFSEGFDDYSTARVRLDIAGGRPIVEVHTAAAEVGQGLVTIMAQIARTELGVPDVVVRTSDTQVGSAGSTSAARQTYCTGGAVKTACEAVRDGVLLLAYEKLGHLWPGILHHRKDFLLEDGNIIAPDGLVVTTLADLLGDSGFDETREFRHPPTFPLHPVTGQGHGHTQFSFAAHRAVVDVDTELGLVRVVEMAISQDVGKALNPQAVEGQLEGGTAQGMGLAIMEEIQVVGGKVLNPSFTDYLIPTILDMPPVRTDVLELGDPHAPYGIKGIGEAPNVSSVAATANAIRNATGRPIVRVPVQPDHIVL